MDIHVAFFHKDQSDSRCFLPPGNAGVSINFQWKIYGVNETPIFALFPHTCTNVNWESTSASPDAVWLIRCNHSKEAACPWVTQTSHPPFKGNANSKSEAWTYIWLRDTILMAYSEQQIEIEALDVRAVVVVTVILA